MSPQSRSKKIEISRAEDVKWLKVFLKIQNESLFQEQAWCYFYSRTREEKYDWEFVSKIQDNGDIEKVRVSMITSSCNCGTDLTDFLF